jgi:hypothetical protein
MGEVEFADLIYLHSEQYIQDQQRLGREGPWPTPLFGLKEGRIAKASHGRDPLYLFAALQRQLGYPEVPRLRPAAEERGVLQMLENKIRELEMRLRLLEGEVRGQIDVIQSLGQPEIAEPPPQPPPPAGRIARAGSNTPRTSHHEPNFLQKPGLETSSTKSLSLC